MRKSVQAAKKINDNTFHIAKQWEKLRHKQNIHADKLNKDKTFERDMMSPHFTKEM